jgi:integrase
MSQWGIRYAIQERARQASVEHVHPHRFRHTFASDWLMDGGNEGDLMHLMGWSSKTMLPRYGRAAAARRAREAHKHHSPADKL